LGDECRNFETDGAEVSMSVLVEAGASFIMFRPTGPALLPVTRPTPKRSIFDKAHIKAITYNEIR